MKPHSHKRLYALVFALAFSANSMAEPFSHINVTCNGATFSTYQTETETAAKETVVFLSGPTDTWASDALWAFSVLVALKPDLRAIAIDRRNQGLSSVGGDGSYQGFAKDLGCLLPKISAKPVHVLSFASSNLSVLHYVHLFGSSQIKSVMFIDPDGLADSNIEFYAQQADPFKNPEIADYIRSGKYDERMKGKINKDREHAKALIGEPIWNGILPSVEALLIERSNRERIIAQFADIAQYDRDVKSAALLPWPETVPVWAIDTAFETLSIDPAKPDEREKWLNWQKNNAVWMQGLPGVCYIELSQTEHLFQLQAPKQLASWLKQLISGEKCPYTS